MNSLNLDLAATVKKLKSWCESIPPMKLEIKKLETEGSQNHIMLDRKINAIDDKMDKQERMVEAKVQSLKHLDNEMS